MNENQAVIIRLTGKKKQYPFGGQCVGTGYHFLAEKNYDATVSGSSCFVTDEKGNKVYLRRAPLPKSVTNYDFMVSHPADWNGAAYFNVVSVG